MNFPCFFPGQRVQLLWGWASWGSGWIVESWENRSRPRVRWAPTGSTLYVVALSQSILGGISPSETEIDPSLRIWAKQFRLIIVHPSNLILIEKEYTV